MKSPLLIILWKDLLKRKNHYFLTALEVLLPVGLIFMTNMASLSDFSDIDNAPMSFDSFKENKCLLKHGYYDSLIYTPSSPFTDLLMSKAACYAGYKKSNVRSGDITNTTSYFSIGIKFEGISDKESTIPEVLNYTLFPTNKVWLNMHSLWRFPLKPIPRYSIPVLQNVIELQRAIDASYLYLNNITVSELDLQNTDLYSRSPRVFSISIYFCLFLALSLMVPSIMSRIIEEKSTGAKELMLMVGVPRWQLWVAKFLDVILFQSIAIAGIVIFLCVPLTDDSTTLNVSPFILWGVLMYGLVSVIFFLFFLSCCIDRPTVAVFLTELIWACSFMLYYYISSLIKLPKLIRYLASLLPHTNLMAGISILLNYDFYEKDLKLTEKLSGDENTLTLLDILLMMTFDAVLYLYLTWYMDQVKPGKYGVPQPYNFCFKKSYWSPSKVNTSGSFELSTMSRDKLEPVPPGQKPRISLRNVSKELRSANKGVITAVDNVSIDFYHGEISGLLGRNGAGKTTLCSMITGLTYPTSGQILIDGYDLRLELSEARRSLGLCPQHDMLFEDLSAAQTLKFYGVIKGLTVKTAKEEADVLIKKLKLDDVKNTRTSKLSGGQKRKVSLAITLIGNSEVLILDEPTSGMDTEIRREIWELLLEIRRQKMILLTTHFMEEADALCDRIAIMDHGRIKCCGSPMFLKNLCSSGYTLSVVVKANKLDKFLRFMNDFRDAAKLKSKNFGTCYFEVQNTEILMQILLHLENMQEWDEITSYDVSTFTLEDVFLSLTAAEREEFDVIDSPPYKRLDTAEDLDTHKNPLLCIYQLWILIVKKWILFLRLYKPFLCFTVLQGLILAAHLFLNKAPRKAPDLKIGEPLTYSMELYSPSLVLYTNGGVPNIKTAFEEFITSSGNDVKEVPDIHESVEAIFKEDFYTYARLLNLAVDFLPEKINLLHNDEAVHMLPVSLNMIHNFLLAQWNINRDIVTRVDVRFATKNFVPSGLIPSGCSLDQLPDICGIQTLFYVIGPLKERLQGAKDIQLMIVSPLLYWASNLILDAISFTGVMYVIWLTVGYTIVDEYSAIVERADEVLPSLLLWGIGLILIAYIISTVAKTITGAICVSSVLYVVCVFFLYNLIGLNRLPKLLLGIHPNCLLKFGYSDLCAGKRSNYIRELFIYDCLLFLFLLLKDSKCTTWIVHRLLNFRLKVNYSLFEKKDEYVRKEEERAQKCAREIKLSTSKKKPWRNCANEGSGKPDAVLVVDGLKRWFVKRLKPSPAVRGISFAVNKGECFGLLGVNGAGKTTTFRMLTGGLPPSDGNTYIGRDQVHFHSRHKLLASIGYCPQSGGLIHSFKGGELLRFFGRLRGVPGSRIDVEVQRWLENLNLLEFANEKCGSYSGGNQRILSTAISLIGNCPLIFLDEPTSGVDPVSRRLLWTVIRDVQKKGQSVVLTSHSMDECEALCSRLAIMVNGRFRCIGETTTLKDRFGKGYSIQLKISSRAQPEEISGLKRQMKEAFFEQEVILKDEHLTILQYQVTDKSIPWHELFTRLERLKMDSRILESYAASATTLEQIFIDFARNKENCVLVIDPDDV